MSIECGQQESSLLAPHDFSIEKFNKHKKTNK